MTTGPLKRCRSWSVGLALFAAVTLAAQERTDFSGRWVLDSPRESGPDIPSELTVRQSVARTTTTGEPMVPFFKDITIERRFASGITSETFAIGLVGGVVSGVARGAPGNGSAGTKGHYSVRWEGDSLVFESGTSTEQASGRSVWAERREVWSLQTDGRLRVVATHRSALESAGEVIALYRRG
jgi:hypothetical protein